MNGFVFFSQVITSPIYMRLFVNAVKSGHYKYSVGYVKAAFSFYSIWNLDFFRLLYNPFCIHSHVIPELTFALDYLVAFYPLFLIVFTYIFVILHERNCKFIVFLWKPFHKFFARFRSQWSIKKSLVHAFSTFIVLSYVKILCVSFDLLLPTFALTSPSNHRHLYSYYDPTIPFLSFDHSLCSLMAIVIILLCFIFPLLLLLAYPCRCFQRILNIRSPAVHIFMDTLIGCYRHDSAYCRGFAGIYFLLRLVLLVVFELTLSLVYISSVSAVVMLAAVLFAVAHPYKKVAHNVMDVVFLISLAMCFNIESEVIFSEVYLSRHDFFLVFFLTVLVIPALYPMCLFLRFLYHCSLVQRISAWCKHRYGRSQELVDSIVVEGDCYGATSSQ